MGVAGNISNVLQGAGPPPPVYPFIASVVPAQISCAAGATVVTLTGTGFSPTTNWVTWGNWFTPTPVPSTGGAGTEVVVTLNAADISPSVCPGGSPGKPLSLSNNVDSSNTLNLPVVP